MPSELPVIIWIVFTGEQIGKKLNNFWSLKKNNRITTKYFFDSFHRLKNGEKLNNFQNLKIKNSTTTQTKTGKGTLVLFMLLKKFCFVMVDAG
jgi:hypothetical protein